MTPVEHLIAFVHTKAPAEPILDRAKLYLGLATICGDAQQERAYKQMAASLQEAELRCRTHELPFVAKG